MCGLAGLIAALTIMAGSAFCQPRDVDGWGKIKWGMSVSEARAAYGDEAREPTLKPAPGTVLVNRIILKDFKIGDIITEVDLQSAPRSELITAVTIGTTDALDDVDGRSRDFTRLKKLLIEKYGSPKNEDRKPNDSDGEDCTVFWSFPSTSITLSWLERIVGRGSSVGGFRFGSVSVQYRPVDKKALDVLRKGRHGAHARKTPQAGRRGLWAADGRISFAWIFPASLWFRGLFRLEIIDSIAVTCARLCFAWISLGLAHDGRGINNIRAKISGGLPNLAK